MSCLNDSKGFAGANVVRGRMDKPKRFRSPRSLLIKGNIALLSSLAKIRNPGGMMRKSRAPLQAPKILLYSVDLQLCKNHGRLMEIVKS